MALPIGVQAKVSRGEALTPAEAGLVAGASATGGRIVGVIPRLAPVARILRYASSDFEGRLGDPDAISGAELPLESRILRAVTDFLEEMRGRRNADAVLGKLGLAKGAYDPAVLSALERAVLEGPGPEDRSARCLPVEGLHAGLCLLEDIRTQDGALVLGAGTRLAPIHLERLRSVAAIAALPGPVLVTA